jgi:hypothetical protein
MPLDIKKLGPMTATAFASSEIATIPGAALVVGALHVCIVACAGIFPASAKRATSPS